MTLPRQPALRFGSSTPEVGNWQRFLTSVPDSVIRPDRDLVTDEIFGIKTDACTKGFQKAHGLIPDGIVGPKTRAVAVPLGFIEFVQAKHFELRWPRTRPITLIVIHTMECLEAPDAAENVALWFAGKTAYAPPMASAHFCVDADATVQCVRVADVAWHAKQVNPRSIGIEHAGFARQSPAEWEDDYSRAVLKRSAALVQQLAEVYQIPIRRLDPAEIRAGLLGLCGHVDVTNAYDKGVGHWDPGPGFVWEEFLRQCGA
jgi:peptidoglycan hydrolase-like protein with peptidoglycan-binding domain